METNGERNRVLYLIKSRGTSHSNQLAEFELTDHGIRILDPYIGPAGVLTGSARLTQEAADTAQSLARAQEIDTRGRDLQRRREAVEAQVAALWRDFEAEADAVQQLRTDAAAGESGRADLRAVMGRHRWAPTSSAGENGTPPPRAGDGPLGDHR